MNPINKLNLSSGKYLYLDPRYHVHETETSYLIYGKQQEALLIPCALDGTISDKSAASLCQRNIASFERSKIFSDARLCQALFNWDSVPEINYLLGTIEQYAAKAVLDVGCGHGRLLIPLWQQGINVWGIDTSIRLIDALNETAGFLEFPRGIYADMAQFAIPNYFDLAFAAMNTVRYLEDIGKIKRHLSILALSLKKGGVYLINRMLSPSPHENYHYQWSFDYQNSVKRCEWKFDSYCHLTNRIIDKITIWETNAAEKSVIFQEFQAQAHISAKIFKDILDQVKDQWSLERVADANGQACEFGPNLHGNHWLTLKKN